MSKTYRILLICLIIIALLGAAAALRYPHLVFARALPLIFDESDPELPSRLWLNYSREYLAQLRTEFGLEAVVEGCESDLEQVRAVTGWVNGLWAHDGSNMPTASDPITILREAAAGGRFRCVEYSIAIAGCLEAIGIQARVLGLKTRDVETRRSGAGHVVAEAYLRDLDKWVMSDGQWNVIPESSGTPLNAVELQRALVIGDKGLQLSGVRGLAGMLYRRWIVQYLYYFDTMAEGEHIMLGPVGAPQPLVFQGRHPLDVTMYTHSPMVLYESPE